MKRLRLRGDWSDTGPRARPESERERDGKITAVCTAGDAHVLPLVGFRAEVCSYGSDLRDARPLVMNVLATHYLCHLDSFLDPY